MIQIPQSTTRRVMLNLFTTGTTTKATGKTVAVVLSKAGGVFANPSAGATNATELSNGWYYVDLSTTDTGTLGDLVVRGTASGCDDCERVFGVVKATNAGLTGVPDAVAGANGGLPTGNASGHVTLADASLVTAKLGTFALAKTTNITGFNDIAATAIVSSGAITTSGGAVATVTNLTNAPSAGDFTTTMKTSIGTAVAASAVASVTAPVTVTGTPDVNVTSWAGSAVDALTTDPIPANLVAILDTVLTETVAGYLAAAFEKLFDVATPVMTVASVNQTGDAYAAVGNLPTLAQILAGGDVDGFTVEQALKLILATAVGKLSGAATTINVIRAADDTKTRVTATVDADGNRTSVTLDAAG